MPRTGRGKPKKERAKEDISKQVGRHSGPGGMDHDGYEWKEPYSDLKTQNAIFKRGDKEFAKESNKAPGSNAKKKHTNKGSAGVREGYNPNTNAFRQYQDKETGELAHRRERWYPVKWLENKN